MRNCLDPVDVNVIASRNSSVIYLDLEDESDISKMIGKTPAQKLPDDNFRERRVHLEIPRSHIAINMERLQLWPSRLLHFLCIVLLLSLAVPVDALFFYIDSTTPKCFYEELPKDTLVVGQLSPQKVFDFPYFSHLLEICLSCLTWR